MVEDVRSTLLGHLASRYGDLKRRLTRLLGSDDLAGDALQDTWLRLQRMDADTSPIMNPHAFLLRMAANIAVDQRRSQSRALPPGEIAELLDLADHAPGPEQTVEARSEVQALLRLLERMPARRREILIMVRLEGMLQKEVAERLGISLRTVEHELKRAHDFCMSRLDEKK
ncbi:RNA polymerase sigma factor [Herbaspirillum sp. alder98]|uniref:RNA polymerase sigma factor n=1 Tax=Herbaspirillum sp. alder98 TaxID=2913096 RepID=UPI001CD83D6E|nr:RNA polymerase sigma factor [Herbaspirillum sp. alder98]MCA1325590.1 RNA polymerase sigma factor [Herbaspirillum sp. alder98]